MAQCTTVPWATLTLATLGTWAALAPGHAAVPPGQGATGAVRPEQVQAAALAAARSTTTEALARPALPSLRASQSVMLSAAHAGARIVAVGERGIILFSDDSGKQWQQAQVPASVTLTSVRFSDARRGVAVGHAGLVLTTSDGGQHWQRVLDGKRIAALALESARASGDARAIQDAERLVADGPDKPLLDVCLLGDDRILVVGAYGLAFGSEDGGRTWTSWMTRLDNPQGLHLNAVRQHGSTIVIAGERGIGLLSRDAGRTFERLRLPYQGSFFTVELTDHAILLAGLRGNVWASGDHGQSWRKVANPVPVSITGSAIRANGTPVFANQAGVLLAMQGATLTPIPANPLPPLTGLLELNNGDLLALTIQGFMPVPVKPVAGATP